MTTQTNDDLRQYLDCPDALMQRLTADLETACNAPVPPDLQEAMARHLASAARKPARRRSMLGGVRVRSRLTSLAAAALIIAAGTVGYARLQSPTPVSAAQILRRAAAAMSEVPVGDVVHEVTQMHLSAAVTPPPNDDLTFEQWTQVNGEGNPLQADLVAKSANRALDERLVADAQGHMWTYGPTADTVTKSTWTPGKPLFSGPKPTDPQGIIFLPKEMMDSPQDPNTMRDLLNAAASGSDGQMKRLDPQTIDGRAMDVVQVTHAAGDATSPFPPGWSLEVYTIYLDASTHLVRRIDVKGMSDQGATVYQQTFDVTTYEVLPLSQVPAGTFTFTPAPGTKVCEPLEPGAGPGASPPCNTVGGNR